LSTVAAGIGGTAADEKGQSASRPPGGLADSLRIETLWVEAGYRTGPEDQRIELAAAREILIRYRGAVGAPPELTRSRDEAKALAERLAHEARLNPAAFDSLVATYSEGPTRDKFGFVAPFATGARPKAFEEAVFRLKLGEVSAEPAESLYGFHVLLRDPADMFGARLILIRHKEAYGAERRRATRTREDALALAKAVRARVVAHPDSFIALANAYSDGPKAGYLGFFHVYTYGRKIWEVTKATPIGKISDVFETSAGFNFVQRLN
jgi:hypothetical protein